MGGTGGCGRFVWGRGTLEVRGEEGEGALEVVDGFEIEVAFVACRKGMVTADDVFGLLVYL